MKTGTFLLRLINILVVLTMTLGSPMSAMAAVWTDQADYSPGSIVTISGDNSDAAGYLPGETVHVDVAGPNGYTATCEGVADDSGAWSCQVTLWDSYLAEGSYTYTATGLTSLVIQTGSFTDAAGSYSLNWSAADPKISNAPYLPTYTKVPPSSLACPTPSGSGGRAADPLQHAVFGNPKDSVESLAPPDMALGQIVPFELKITVSGSTAPEGGVILVTPYWLTKTTSGGNFGFDPAYEVYCAFVDTADSASIDPGANAKVDSWTDTVVGTGTSNEQIQGTIQVSGLDSGDSIIVEIWVVLKSTIPAGVSGNVQTGLFSAFTAAGGDLKPGNQTVPLLQVGAFFSSDADVSVTKSDSPDPVFAGGNLTYSLVVKNNATAVIANGVVVTDTLDPNTSFVSASGASCTAASGVLTCNVGALAPQQQITITVIVAVSATAPTAGTVSTGTCTVGAAGVDLCNRVSVTAINSDPNTANNSDSEPTDVIKASLAIVKTTNGSDGPTLLVGAPVTWTYVVTNTGTVTLDGIAVSDNKGVAVSCPKTTLTAGESMTCTGSGTAAAGNYSNIGTAAGVYNTTPVSASDPSSYFGAAPAIDVKKYVSVDGGASWDNADAVPGPLLASGTAPQFKFVVTNSGNVALSGITLSDSDFSLSTCTIPATLAAGASFECVITSAWAAGQHTNTASASGSYGSTAYTDTDDANYYGAIISIDVEKYVSVDGGANWVDADAAPGPSLLSGTAPKFQFVVTNTSNVALSGITLTDSDFDLTGCAIPATLAAGASFPCVITAPWAAGQHTNTATADSTESAPDTDDANYFGAAPAITVQKTPDTQTVIYGQTATFTIQVTNTGNVDLTDVAVTDPLAPNCAAVIGALAAGANATYTCTLANVTTGFTNVATAAGNYGGVTVTDDDDAVVIVDVLPDISVTKTANPTSVPETGGDVEFTFVVTNHSSEPFLLNSLTDDKFGDLNTQGTCVVPQTIAAGQNYTCAVTKFLAGDTLTAHTNVVTAAGTDQQGNPDSATDDETVIFSNVAPTVDLTKTATPTSLPEPGGEFTYTLSIHNTSAEVVTITALTDDNTLSDACLALIGTPIAAGATISCTYTVTRTEVGSYPNTANVAVTDNEGSTATDSDSETVTVTDIAPTVDLTKTADPLTLAEPGGMFTYTLTIHNTSIEPVKITALTDTNTLSPQCLALINTSLAADATVSCTYTVTHTDAGSYLNTANVTVTDNENTTAQDNASATVSVTNVMPTVVLTKTADPATRAEPGGLFTFTLTIQNTSVEPVTITALTDTNTLSTECNALVGTSIAPGGSASCTYPVTHTESGSYENTATVTVTDNEGNPALSSDTETVTVTDVLPTVDLTKAVDLTTLPEPGGVFTFTLTIHNTSVEPVTLTALTDTNTLSAQCLALVGTTIVPNGTVTCSYPVTHTEVGSYDNTANVTVTDNENNPASDSDTKTVTVTNVLPIITITKTASPISVPETGGNVTFTFLVENTGMEDVTLTILTDSVFGDLAGQGTCATGGLIPVGGSYSCSITKFLASDSLTAHTNIAKATASDNEGTTATDDDDETVTFTDVAPVIRITKTASPTHVPETGGDVTFTFLVENIGQEDVTLNTLSDNVFGDLNDQGTCVVPQTILIGGSYSCAFTVNLSSDSLTAHTNVVTATAVDDDNTPATATDDETVTFTDVPPQITIRKTASPTSVPETGGEVTFTFLVTNTGPEDVTLTSLSDTRFGNLDDKGTCAVPQTILIGGSYTCTYTVTLASDSLTAHTNAVIAIAVDDDGTSTNATDDETVTFTDVAPAIRITKTANPTSVPETGGDVTFTFLVENIGQEDVTLTTLSDTVFGDLDGKGTCDVPQTILIRGSYSCAITVNLASDSLTAHTNVVTATAVDDDNTPATDDDDETVTFDDVRPDISVTKTASPTSVPEPGGSVTFTFVVTNSGTEAATITSLSDSVFGTLLGNDDCKVGTVLAAKASCEFTITETISGDANSSHTNVVTVEASDNDGNTDSATDDATVTVTDVLPTVDLTKEASPLTMAEPGGVFTFTLTIQNTSVEPVTITALTDMNALSPQCQALVNTILAVGETVSCTYTVTHTEAGIYDNTANVTVTDNEGTTAEDTASATVTVTDVAPTVELTKAVDLTTLPEPGGLFTFTLSIKNTSVEPVIITALTDTNTLSAECNALVGTSLAAGATVSCDYTVTLTEAGSYTNTAAVTVTDNEDNKASDSDDETVIVTDVLPVITIEKSADPTSVPETGGNVTFTFVVTNQSVETVTLTSLTDTVFENLSGKGTCAVPQTIAAGESYTCSFSQFLASDTLTAHTNVATAAATDNDGNTATDDDDATVTFTNVAPEITITKTADPTSVPETGGDVTFTFLVENIGQEDVTLTELTDTVFGNLAGKGTCVVPQTILIGGSYSCAITVNLASDSLTAHTNVVTAVGTDDDGTTDEATDDETVEFTDVAPAIRITKSANPTHVPETGGNVTFTFLVENIGLEDVTLTSLTDTVFGDLDGKGTCDVPQTILIRGSYSCAITVNLASDSLTDHTNVVTAVGTDDDGTTDEATDDETVTFDDVAPAITITKTANPTSVPETGGDVTFTFLVENIGQEDVTLTTLSDTVFGDLAGKGSCAVPQTILIGGSYSCSITVNLASDSLTAHSNVVTAVGTDDDGTTDEATDDETVTFTDVAPAIRITKTANPTSVPETGGDVTFTFLVENIGQEDVTLTELTDTVFGNLNGKGTCVVPQTILIGDSYSCEVTVNLASDSLTAHKNVVTATAVDDDNTPATDTDDETVTFDDVAPLITITKSASPTHVPETGGDVTFTFLVENIGREDVTLTTLSDTVFGDLAGKGSCAVPQTILIGGSYSCAITVTLSSDSLTDHYNVATATAVDDDDTPATDTDDETITFDDVAPLVRMTKTASPTSVPETGGSVTFTFLVENIGLEDVTLTTLSDTKFGDLNGKGTCAVPQTILIGGSYSCTYTVTLSSDTLTAHTNVVTATAVDDDGTTATDDDEETVTFDDVLPDISVTKTASPTSVPEPGGSVTFTFVVTNNSAEAAKITSLSDSVFGTLAGDADCAVGTVLAGGASCTFTITRMISGNANFVHTNLVTVVASDNDGNADTATDDATVTVTDVMPSIDVTKTANKTSILFTGETVTYTITVKNTSVEPVSLTSLVDDKFGDLDKDTLLPHTWATSTCDVPRTLAIAATYTCTFTATVSYPYTPDSPLVTGAHTNWVTGTAYDDEGNPAIDKDDATVSFYWRGRTPGYWKNKTKEWPKSFTITNHNGVLVTITTSTPVTSVFNVPASLLKNGILDLNNNRKNDTLLEALGYQGGETLAGKAQILLRAAVAALLNEKYFGANYPPYATVTELINAVNAVLATKDPAQYIQMANKLDWWNNGVH